MRDLKSEATKAMTEEEISALQEKVNPMKNEDLETFIGSLDADQMGYDETEGVEEDGIEDNEPTNEA